MIYFTLINATMISYMFEVIEAPKLQCNAGGKAPNCGGLNFQARCLNNFLASNWFLFANQNFYTIHSEKYYFRFARYFLNELQLATRVQIDFLFLIRCFFDGSQNEKSFSRICTKNFACCQSWRFCFYFVSQLIGVLLYVRSQVVLVNELGFSFEAGLAFVRVKGAASMFRPSLIFY